MEQLTRKWKARNDVLGKIMQKGLIEILMSILTEEVPILAQIVGSL